MNQSQSYRTLEEAQHQAAFGEHAGISDHCRFMINDIKNNSIHHDKLELLENYGEFSGLAWKLLGRYIANNTYLKNISFRCCGISDERMSLLFSELVGSESLNNVHLDGNEIGVEGLRNMFLFLRNSPQLKGLHFSGNYDLDTECFEFLVRTLCGTGVEYLSVRHCNITDISSLSTYNLPNLQILSLSGNSIGREGFITLSNLLQQESVTLKHLYLQNVGIGDEEAELLATSLKHNTKLDYLIMTNNNFTERGKGAFLKLLLDASSIENTYNSNHTLNKLCVQSRDATTPTGYKTPIGIREGEIERQILLVINFMNKKNTNSEAIGRAKVIQYQLNSQNRKELCHLQGIESSSIGSNFADIEPTLLPRILALIGKEHGQSEFYTALIPMVPDLMSYIDRRALIDDVIAKNSSDIAALGTEYERRKLALTTKRGELQNRRACMESKANTQGKDEGELMDCGGKKRRID